MTVMRLNLWSGPRNVSTALMYSFAQRADTRVVDEPAYGHYLRVSGVEHPGASEVLSSMDCDGNRVIREVVLGPCDRPILFLKQMAHHLTGLDRSFLTETQNAFLIRDPREMLPSLAENLPDPSLQDTGLQVQSRLFDELRALGQDPPVLDARYLLLDPAGVLEALCLQLGIPFDPAMLHWSPGARPEDGIWAEHWYSNVHKSQGFHPYRPKTTPFPEHLEALLEECRPYYLHLRDSAIRS